VRALTVLPQQANPIALEERDAPSGEGDLLIAARSRRPDDIKVIVDFTVK
jgi:hypothetical protein